MSTLWSGTHRDGPVYLSLRAGALTLSLDGKVNLSFDGEGRLIGAFWHGITYRRALDNRVLAKWTPHGGSRMRRYLLPDEKRELLERWYGVADGVYRDLGRTPGGVASGQATLPPGAMPWLERIVGWDWQRLEGERERFAEVYRPIPILPPDQYLSLVVQVTEGCSYNECTFCTFYRDRPFRIKTPDQVEAHLQQIRKFMGRGLDYRRGLFLADANAVVVAQRRLAPILERINRAFPVNAPWTPTGIYAFVSAPDALRKSVADFRELAGLGLRRVYVGLESGHDPLRAFLRKPGDGRAVLEAVQTIKAGGVDVGLIVMVGVGGKDFAAAHLADTVALIRQMPLDESDLIYLSPFVDSPGSPYEQAAEAAGIAPLSEEDLTAAEADFRLLLGPWVRSRGARLSRYDIREFLY